MKGHKIADCWKRKSEKQAKKQANYTTAEPQAGSVECVFHALCMASSEYSIMYGELNPYQQSQ